MRQENQYGSTTARRSSPDEYEDGKLRIEVHGELGAIMHLAEGARAGKRTDAAGTEALLGKSRWLRGQDLNL
jgi:hypothetical protein